MNAGLYGINVMTYDFFGTPWAESITHHTNLKAIEQGGWAIGIPARRCGRYGYNRRNRC
jgi:GH18 family chitinase